MIYVLKLALDSIAGLLCICWTTIITSVSFDFKHDLKNKSREPNFIPIGISSNDSLKTLDSSSSMSSLVFDSDESKNSSANNSRRGSPWLFVDSIFKNDITHSQSQSPINLSQAIKNSDKLKRVKSSSCKLDVYLKTDNPYLTFNNLININKEDTYYSQDEVDHLYCKKCKKFFIKKRDKSMSFRYLDSEICTSCYEKLKNSFT